MFLNLFKQECRIILRSILFYAFVLILLLFYGSQYISDVSGVFKNVSAGSRVTTDQFGNKSINPLVKPQETDGFYGFKEAEVPKQVIPRVADTLYQEYKRNSYLAYPFGFAKHVKLSKKEQGKVEGILNEITGSTVEAVDKILQKSVEDYNGTKLDADTILANLRLSISDIIPVSNTLTYERFKVLAEELNNIIGPGSSYSDLKRYGSVPVSYDEAMAEYENLVHKDQVSGAFARVFCDYMGIVLALFPVFVAASYVLKDKRAGIRELIYSRRMSSAGIVGARYLALLIMMFIPVLILGIASTITLSSDLKPLGVTMDYLAFVKYVAAWLLPTLMVTVSIGYLMTELTQSAAGIAVQAAIWIISIMKTPLTGGYGLSYILRHNTLGGYDLYKAGLNHIIINRICYSLAALGLLIVTIVIFDLKRRGRWHVKRKSVKVSMDSQEKSVA